MGLGFTPTLADAYKNPAQKIKNLSEHWVSENVYCPNCGEPRISRYANNRPVADFFCEECSEDYELKSLGRKFGPKVVDGAYGTMMERLRGCNAPNFLFLHYDPAALTVIDLILVPKHFLIPEYIEERKPLSPFAKRAGWIGCKILMLQIPRAGLIFLIRDRLWERKEDVLARWQSTLFLKDQRDFHARGWLLSVMKCIEQIQTSTFSIEDVYRFERQLMAAYPANKHIREKIRQKLQVLRDKGYLEFLGGGKYRLLGPRPG
jgi:type II restriction enzyme